MSRDVRVATLTVLSIGLLLSVCGAQDSNLPAAAGQGQTGAAGRVGTPADAAAALKADKTGTNPANFQNQFVFWNEYVDLGGGLHTNQTVFDYRVPFQDQSVQLRIRIPMVSSDATGETEFGIGDISTRVVKRLKLTRKYALMAGLESWWNTAAEASLGTGKITVAPVMAYVMFYPKSRRIFAPAYQHRLSIGGDDGRADINQGSLDLYLVQMLDHGTRWVVLDPQLIVNYENGDVGALVKLTYGTMAGPGTSIYLRPGVGLGEQPVDWSLEAGYQMIW